MAWRVTKHELLKLRPDLIRQVEQAQLQPATARALVSGPRRGQADPQAARLLLGSCLQAKWPGLFIPQYEIPGAEVFADFAYPAKRLAVVVCGIAWWGPWIIMPFAPREILEHPKRVMTRIDAAIKGGKAQ